jgi:hypothetical protein
MRWERKDSLYVAADKRFLTRVPPPGGNWSFADLSAATVFLDVDADYTGDMSGDLIGHIYDQGPFGKTLHRGDNYTYSYHLATNANLLGRNVLRSPGPSGCAYRMEPNGGVVPTGSSWAVCLIGDNRIVGATYQGWCGESPLAISCVWDVAATMKLRYYGGGWAIGPAPLGPFAILIEYAVGWVTVRDTSGIIAGPFFSTTAADCRWKLTNIGGYWLGGVSQPIDNGDLARLVITDGAWDDADRAGFFQMAAAEYGVL